MSADNPLWGAPRIHGELLSSASRWLNPPSRSTWCDGMAGRPRGWSLGTWRDAAMDLFVVPTLAFNLLYGFIIVRLDRRELVHIAVTNSPTADWIARQITEVNPLGRCARLSDPRPRLRLWLDRKAPRLRDGHPGQTDRAPLTMAERFRRAPDWIHPSRMPGPDHCLRRGASATGLALLRELLQQSSDAPVTQQRRAGASSKFSALAP